MKKEFGGRQRQTRLPINDDAIVDSILRWGYWPKESELMRDLVNLGLLALHQAGRMPPLDLAALRIVRENLLTDIKLVECAIDRLEGDQQRHLLVVVDNTKEHP